ncbi:MAG: YggU family protein [Gemmatimonadetes bacterium]|nr:MAG: YggU family protein [Gemmatimonadota bacterium]
MCVRDTTSGVDITVRAQPRASRSEVVGPHGDALRVRLAAPPVDGAANKELVRLLARTLDVPRSAVDVVSGQSGRTKRVRVDGLDAATARARLGLVDRAAGEGGGAGR